MLQVSLLAIARLQSMVLSWRVTAEVIAILNHNSMLHTSVCFGVKLDTGSSRNALVGAVHIPSRGLIVHSGLREVNAAAGQLLRHNAASVELVVEIIVRLELTIFFHTVARGPS